MAVIKKGEIKLKKGLLLVLSYILFLVFVTPGIAENNQENDYLKGVDKKALNELGISDEELNKIGDNVHVIDALVKSKEVKTKEHAKNLKEAFLKPKTYKAERHNVVNKKVKTETVEIPVTGVKEEVERILQDNGDNQTNSVNEIQMSTLETVTATCPNTLDGYHYIVRSVWNRNKASGNITFPWGIHVTNWNGVQNEVPYMFFGIYNSDGAKGGADVGLYFDNVKKKWYPFFNGWNSSQGYVWMETDKSTYPGIANSTPVHMVVTEKSNAIEIKLLDRNTWTEISTTLFNVSSSFGFNANGTNTRFNKETSLATHCYSGTSGAYIKGAYWSNAYIYWPTGNHIWDSTQTVRAEWKPDQNKVTQFANVINYYQDQISIEYK